MTLKELDALLAAVRKDGATDDSVIYLTSKKLKYMRHIGSVQFQKRESWPEKEWPVVIAAKS
jgi:hypothetical protein